MAPWRHHLVATQFASDEGAARLRILEAEHIGLQAAAATVLGAAAAGQAAAGALADRAVGAYRRETLARPGRANQGCPSPFP